MAYSNIEFKSNPGQFNIDEAQGIVECFVAGIGNKDSVGDVLVPGAFTESLKRRKPRVVWGHNWNDPIGKVLDIYEVGPGDPRLPQKMKTAGIGGLYARVQFNLNSEKGREAFANVAFFGHEQEWSIGYKTLDAIHDPAIQANVLKEVELYEVSPVLHGANQLTGTISVKSDDVALSDMEKGWGMMPGHHMQPKPMHQPNIIVIREDEDDDDKYESEKPIFAEGLAQPIGGEQRQRLEREIMERTGSQVRLLQATENTALFSRMMPNGASATFRIGYHTPDNYRTFMFGKPELANGEMKPSQIGKPSGSRVVVPSQMPSMPMQVKPNYEQNVPMDMFKSEEGEKSDLASQVQALEDLIMEEAEQKVGKTINKRNLSKLKSILEGLQEVIASAEKEEMATKSYVIPVELKNAFHTKQLLDPIFDYHRVEAEVTEDGILVTSGVTEEFIEAIGVAEKALGRAIGGGAGKVRRGARGLASRFDPNAWDGDGDGLVQEGTPFQRPAIPGVNDRSTRGRVDVSAATRAFQQQADKKPSKERGMRSSNELASEKMSRDKVVREKFNPDTFIESINKVNSPEELGRWLSTGILFSYEDAEVETDEYEAFARTSIQLRGTLKEIFEQIEDEIGSGLEDTPWSDGEQSVNDDDFAKAIDELEKRLGKGKEYQITFSGIAEARYDDGRGDYPSGWELNYDDDTQFYTIEEVKPKERGMASSFGKRNRTSEEEADELYEYAKSEGQRTGDENLIAAWQRGDMGMMTEKDFEFLRQQQLIDWIVESGGDEKDEELERILDVWTGVRRGRLKKKDFEYVRSRKEGKKRREDEKSNRRSMERVNDQQDRPVNDAEKDQILDWAATQKGMVDYRVEQLATRPASDRDKIIDEDTWQRLKKAWLGSEAPDPQPLSRRMDNGELGPSEFFESRYVAHMREKGMTGLLEKWQKNEMTQKDWESVKRSYDLGKDGWRNKESSSYRGITRRERRDIERRIDPDDGLSTWNKLTPFEQETLDVRRSRRQAPSTRSRQDRGMRSESRGSSASRADADKLAKNAIAKDIEAGVRVRTLTDEQAELISEVVNGIDFAEFNESPGKALSKIRRPIIDAINDGDIEVDDEVDFTDGIRSAIMAGLREYEKAGIVKPREGSTRNGRNANERIAEEWALEFEKELRDTERPKSKKQIEKAKTLSRKNRERLISDLEDGDIGSDNAFQVALDEVISNDPSLNKEKFIDEVLAAIDDGLENDPENEVLKKLRDKYEGDRGRNILRAYAEVSANESDFNTQRLDEDLEVSRGMASRSGGGPGTPVTEVEKKKVLRDRAAVDLYKDTDSYRDSLASWKAKNPGKSDKDFEKSNEFVDGLVAFDRDLYAQAEATTGIPQNRMMAYGGKPMSSEDATAKSILRQRMTGASIREVAERIGISPEKARSLEAKEVARLREEASEREVLAYRLGGLSLSDTANLFGMNPKDVRRVEAREMAKIRENMTDDDLLELRMMGFSLEDISEITGIPRTELRKREIKRINRGPEGKGPDSPETPESRGMASQNIRPNSGVVKYSSELLDGKLDDLASDPQPGMAGATLDREWAEGVLAGLRDGRLSSDDAINLIGLAGQDVFNEGRKPEADRDQSLIDSRIKLSKRLRRAVVDDMSPEDMENYQADRRRRMGADRGMRSTLSEANRRRDEGLTPGTGDERPSASAPRGESAAGYTPDTSERDEKIIQKLRDIGLSDDEITQLTGIENLPSPDRGMSSSTGRSGDNWNFPNLQLDDNEKSAIREIEDEFPDVSREALANIAVGSQLAGDWGYERSGIARAFGIDEDDVEKIAKRFEAALSKTTSDPKKKMKIEGGNSEIDEMIKDLQAIRQLSNTEMTEIPKLIDALRKAKENDGNLEASNQELAGYIRELNRIEDDGFEDFDNANKLRSMVSEMFSSRDESSLTEEEKERLDAIEDNQFEAFMDERGMASRGNRGLEELGSEIYERDGDGALADFLINENILEAEDPLIRNLRREGSRPSGSPSYDERYAEQALSLLEENSQKERGMSSRTRKKFRSESGVINPHPKIEMTLDGDSLGLIVEDLDALIRNNPRSSALKAARDKFANAKSGDKISMTNAEYEGIYRDAERAKTSGNIPSSQLVSLLDQTAESKDGKYVHPDLGSGRGMASKTPKGRRPNNGAPTDITEAMQKEYIFWARNNPNLYVAQRILAKYDKNDGELSPSDWRALDTLYTNLSPRGGGRRSGMRSSTKPTLYGSGDKEKDTGGADLRSFEEMSDTPSVRAMGLGDIGARDVGDTQLEQTGPSDAKFTGSSFNDVKPDNWDELDLEEQFEWMFSNGRPENSGMSQAAYEGALKKLIDEEDKIQRAADRKTRRERAKEEEGDRGMSSSSLSKRAKDSGLKPASVGNISKAEKAYSAYSQAKSSDRGMRSGSGPQKQGRTMITDEATYFGQIDRSLPTEIRKATEAKDSKVAGGLRLLQSLISRQEAAKTGDRRTNVGSLFMTADEADQILDALMWVLDRQVQRDGNPERIAAFAKLVDKIAEAAMSTFIDKDTAEIGSRKQKRTSRTGRTVEIPKTNL